MGTSLFDMMPTLRSSGGRQVRRVPGVCCVFQGAAGVCGRKRLYPVGSAKSCAEGRRLNPPVRLRLENLQNQA